MAAKTSFVDLQPTHASGGATGERSDYGPPANLPNAVGATLKPQVLCVGDLAGQRASCRDLSFCEGAQVANSRSLVGQTLNCGVEVKITRNEAPRARGPRIPLPDGWSDVAADDAVGVVAVSAARALGDTVTIFGGRGQGVGRNG